MKSYQKDFNMNKKQIRPEIKIDNLYKNEETQWVIRSREDDDPIRVYSLLDKNNNSLCDVQCSLHTQMLEDDVINTKTLLSIQNHNHDNLLSKDITRRVVSLLRHQKVNEIDLEKIQDSLYDNGVVALMEADKDHNMNNMSLSFRAIKTVLKDREMREKFNSDPEEYESLEDRLLPPYELLTSIEPKIHWLNLPELLNNQKIEQMEEPIKKSKGLEI